MTGNKKTLSLIDPENGEEDNVTIETEVNGWEHDPDSRRAAVTWMHPDNDSVYVGYEKTGGYSYSAWVSVPGKTLRNTIYKSFGSATEAIDEAHRIMRRYSPDEAAEKDW